MPCITAPASATGTGELSKLPTAILADQVVARETQQNSLRCPGDPSMW